MDKIRKLMIEINKNKNKINDKNSSLKDIYKEIDGKRVNINKTNVKKPVYKQLINLSNEDYEEMYSRLSRNTSPQTAFVNALLRERIKAPQKVLSNIDKNILSERWGINLDEYQEIEQKIARMRANIQLVSKRSNKSEEFVFNITRALPDRMYLSMKSNREMARIVLGEKRAKDLNKEFKNDIVDIPIGNIKQVEQAMENLFNKVVMQRGLSQEELDMVRVLSEGMTTTEFETFYQEYKPIVEEMFYSSDSRVMYSGKYLKDGKIHYIENGVVSGGEKREIARDFIDSLRRFRGLTQEELDATVSVKGYRYDKNGNRL